ncbi:MAG: MoaD/ThiS family protein [Candidatus Thorarchaeota archaeon]
MINVKITFLSLLADLFGNEPFPILLNEDSTIKDIFERLTTKFGKKFKEIISHNSDSLNKYVLVGLNGKDIRLFEDTTTILHDGDELSFLPAIAGG